MNVENVGSSIAMIVDETKPNSNLLLSVESNEDNVINYLKELKLKPKQHFQIIPISVARDILYVVGASNPISLVSLRTSTGNYIRNGKSF